jgi:hypothetical protein
LGIFPAGPTLFHRDPNSTHPLFRQPATITAKPTSAIRSTVPELTGDPGPFMRRRDPMRPCGAAIALLPLVQLSRRPMSPDDLRTLIAAGRAETSAALDRLAAVEPATLPRDIRVEYDAVRQGWEELRTMTEDDVVALHEAACLWAGQELTSDELCGLLGLQ